MHNIKKMVEKELKKIEHEGLNKQNLETLYKLVDIHKDISNEEYWENSEEVMDMYGREDYNERGYGARGGRGRGGSRGGSRGGGRGRGSGTRYGADERMNDVMDGWEDYREGMEEYKERGSYGAKEKGLESLEFMLDAFVKWFEDISRDAETQEEVDLIKKYANKIKNV